MTFYLNFLLEFFLCQELKFDPTFNLPVLFIIYSNKTDGTTVTIDFTTQQHLSEYALKTIESRAPDWFYYRKYPDKQRSSL